MNMTIVQIFTAISPRNLTHLIGNHLTVSSTKLGQREIVAGMLLKFSNTGFTKSCTGHTYSVHFN